VCLSPRLLATVASCLRLQCLPLNGLTSFLDLGHPSQDVDSTSGVRTPEPAYCRSGKSGIPSIVPAYPTSNLLIQAETEALSPHIVIMAGTSDLRRSSRLTDPSYRRRTTWDLPRIVSVSLLSFDHFATMLTRRLSFDRASHHLSGETHTHIPFGRRRTMMPIIWMLTM
jgi:hypothetical protein